ncbi:orotate phosphoribosyltransferase [Paenisporosarcina cavernae]|uniref:Orotate phosphoribosyltransferase n=1 Tax=Paenisporosarcina cavernae TaxID=2320858 RepID=A0A385YTE6_9BACL|nr:orotate phosphoribosyltransferase [Paenisporosarcina cavernae]AYC29187.1 orotate phosphoribosyltransferase [Paenisporosarcina cavernae]
MTKETIARALLDVQAVELRPQDPFTWASGIKSPIYCDNRLTMSYPATRKEIASAMAEVISSYFSEVEVLAGTATAGIPHAAWVSDKMELPMVYVRSSAKKHGRGNQIEGRLVPGQKAVVIEDLISTGGSSIEAVRALQEAGCEVLGVVSIFSYGLDRAEEAFQELGIPSISLTDFETLSKEAIVSGAISSEDAEPLKEWHTKLRKGELV